MSAVSLRRAAPLATLALASLVATAVSCSRSIPSEARKRDENAISATGSPGAAAQGIVAADAMAPSRELKAAPASLPDASASSGSATSTQAVTGTAQTPSTIIRTGNASVQVDSLEIAIAALQRIATSLGGWVGNSSLAAGTAEIRSASIELKIPAARYDDALRGLQPIGKVETVASNAEDVGEEFVDLTARVTNAHRLEERLIALLASRTGKLQDALAVEHELARVREEIERQDGRLRYLKARAAISTLVVTVHEPFPVLGNRPGDSPIGDAFREAWRNFVAFTATAIASLGILIPVGVIASLAWLLLRRWRRGMAKAVA
ncbi:MAG: DUF4349 domain-containing protein [Gemmatimonadaceae bacterium]